MRYAIVVKPGPSPCAIIRIDTNQDVYGSGEVRDIAGPGGILRTHRVGDMAFRYGVPMAMHFAGTPVGFMANVHCAAATRNLLALENHSLDVPFWQDLATGIDKPIINKGFIKAPDGPGLGITLNDDEMTRHLNQAPVTLSRRQCGMKSNLGMTRRSADTSESLTARTFCS
jgi:L-alanine-DL-glutamate epimerase-like enolase superfamily enzyme